MEKKISDVISFIRKAMKCNHLIVSNFYNSISVEDKYNSKQIDFSILSNNKLVSVTSDYGKFYIKIETSRDKAELELLMEDVREHLRNIGLQEFDNFFKSDNENPIADINDLDNEEDE